MFTQGETVRIVSGPFNGFTGVVEEVNMSESKLKVKIAIYGRTAPVDMDFSSVEKLT